MQLSGARNGQGGPRRTSPGSASTELLPRRRALPFFPIPSWPTHSITAGDVSFVVLVVLVVVVVVAADATAPASRGLLLSTGWLATATVEGESELDLLDLSLVTSFMILHLDEDPSSFGCFAVQVVECIKTLWILGGNVSVREDSNVGDGFISTQTCSDKFGIVHGIIVKGDGSVIEVGTVAVYRIRIRQTWTVHETNDGAVRVRQRHAQVAYPRVTGGDCEVGVGDDAVRVGEVSDDDLRNVIVLNREIPGYRVLSDEALGEGCRRGDGDERSDDSDDLHDGFFFPDDGGWKQLELEEARRRRRRRRKTVSV